MMAQYSALVMILLCTLPCKIDIHELEYHYCIIGLVFWSALPTFSPIFTIEFCVDYRDGEK